MKKQKYLINILLLAACLPLGGCLDLPHTASQEDAAQEQAAQQGEAEQQEGSRTAADSADLHPYYDYYYTVITEEEQAIYDAALTLLQMPSDDSQVITVSLSVDPSSEDFETERRLAIYALYNDHPEFFWFAGQGSITYTYQDYDGAQEAYEVGMQLSESYAQYEPEAEAFENAADAFLSEIDLSQPDSQIALQIHDKLIDMVTYDTDLYETMDADAENAPDDYGYTAYGALVENSRGQACTAVCEGYSQAYQYLCQRAGLTVAQVSGQAGSAGSDGSAEMEPHSWNLVQLEDGQWYEIDTTWDDCEIGSLNDSSYLDVFQSAQSDASFWNNVRHAYFNLTTGEMTDFEPGDTYTWTMEDGRGITFFGPSTHVRSSSETADDPSAYLNGFAPIADGSTYTWSYLSGI